MIRATPCRAWIDLLDPTAAESARIALETGITVPTRAALQEIESSSRLRADGTTLYVSMPLAQRDDSAGFAPVPLGFILSPQHLITIRYVEVTAFTQAQSRMTTVPEMDSTSIFALLIDSMVDYGADRLEIFSSELAMVSARTFTAQLPEGKAVTSTPPGLRDGLQVVGTVGDQLSRLRESMLGLQRIIAYILKGAADWLPPASKSALATAQQDLISLVDFEAHLSGKTQFLLDAILGFISTEQNDIFKVLTIASVVGIPPTLIASIYGMNFHFMPELAWRWGYPFGLALIVASALAPIIWFKRRGWW